MSTPVLTTYTATGITFAKATSANRAIALTLNATADSLTDVFTPVTLATGKITSASTSTTAIGGTGTAFLTDFDPDDFLFYYTAGASPVLLGRIASVGSNTSITLTENSPIAIGATPGAYCGKTNTDIGVYEEILMRIPVLPFTTGAGGVVTQIIMPNWNTYRETPPTPPVRTSNNLTSSSSMDSYSQVNNPSVIVNPGVRVPYTIAPIFPYQSPAGTFFPTASDFPNYAYALLNPYGSANTGLAANTLYKMFANESFPDNGIIVTTNYTRALFAAAGYF
jgi:hypothetical protein